MKNKYNLELVNTTIPFATDDSLSLYEFIANIVERFNKFADILDHEVQKTVTEQVTKELGEFTEDRILELIRSGEVVEVVNQAVMDKLHELAVITPEERIILERAFDLATDIVPRLEGLDVPLLENVDSEVTLARGAEPTLGARLDGTDAQLADIESKSLKIKNEIVNGNFIDATNWNGLTAPASIENESLKIVLSNAAKNVYQNVANVPIGEKIYLRGKINTDSSKSVLYKSDYGASTNRIFLSGWTLGQWSTVSGIFTTTSVGYTITVGATALTSGTMYYDDIMTINLTKTFGAGKEPTETEMDSLITLIGGWFDGEITVEEKAQVNWLLEKIRSVTDVSSILTEQNQTWAVV